MISWKILDHGYLKFYIKLYNYDKYSSDLKGFCTTRKSLGERSNSKWRHPIDDFLRYYTFSHNVCTSCTNTKEWSSEMLIIVENAHGKLKIRLPSPKRQTYVTVSEISCASVFVLPMGMIFIFGFANFHWSEIF